VQAASAGNTITVRCDFHAANDNVGMMGLLLD